MVFRFVQAFLDQYVLDFDLHVRVKYYIVTS